ncbi:hypothetical protein VaNZ11_008311, partial [Volvox africanus]
MTCQRINVPPGVPPHRARSVRRHSASSTTAAGNVFDSYYRCPFARITYERGFLPSPDPLHRLNLCSHDSIAAEWEAALGDIPKLAVAAGAVRSGDSAIAAGSTSTTVANRGVLRQTLEALPPFPVEKLLLKATSSLVSPTGALPPGGNANAAAAVAAGHDSATREELWRAYLLLSFLAHAYMWCEPGPPPAMLPAILAVPWARIAAAVDMPPILTYASYNLYNWRRLHAAGPVRLGNIVCLQNFLGGIDEEWFRLIHIDIEARAGQAVAGLEAMQRAAVEGDSDAVLAGLITIARALRDMQATLARMGEKCDPYIYYQRVRTPMSGWRNNPDLPQGLVYEGVSTEPIQLYGETGAQSSVLHVFDAGLGIQHDQVWLRDYLDTMVLHMPPAHRAFLRRLAAANGGPANVRSYVQRVATAELRDAYNAAVEELERFRSQHRAFAHSYIAK